MHAWRLWERAEPPLARDAGPDAQRRGEAGPPCARRTSRSQAAVSSDAMRAHCACVTRPVGAGYLLCARRRYWHVCSSGMHGTDRHAAAVFERPLPMRRLIRGADA